MLAWQTIDTREDPFAPRYPGDPADLLDIDSLLAELTGRPAWMADALCREHPEVSWFVSRGEDVRPAKAICSRCLVRDECLAYALEQGVYCNGFWGGTSERERRRLRRPAAA